MKPAANAVLRQMWKLENLTLADIKEQLLDADVTSDEIKEVYLKLNEAVKGILAEDATLTNGKLLGGILFLLMAELTITTADEKILDALVVEQTSATEPRHDA